MKNRLLIGLACGSLLLWAEDPWKSRKASEWDAKDATRVMNDSPWAKTAEAQMNFSRMGGPGGGGMGGMGGGMGGPGGGMGGAGMGGMGGGMGGPGGGMGGPGGGMGGPGGMGGGMQAPKFLVRWESAEPVREAAAKLEDANAAKIAELAKDYYVISASSSMGRQGRRAQEGQGPQGGPNRGDRPQPDMSQMQERTIQSTSLKVKGQDAVKPARVETLQSESGMTTLFLFPRSQAISPEAKEVTFETSMGPMQVKAKFSPKDMLYGGQPAL